MVDVVTENGSCASAPLRMTKAPCSKHSTAPVAGARSTFSSIPETDDVLSLMVQTPRAGRIPPAGAQMYTNQTSHRLSCAARVTSSPKARNGPNGTALFRVTE